MKRFYLALSLFTALTVLAQKPVSWQFSTQSLSDSTAELIMTATIEPGWHLYSQFIPEGGPIPTTFVFEENTTYKSLGGVTEGKPHEEFDPNFDMVLKYFGSKAVFKQTVSILSDKPFTISGELEYMVCNDEMCMPPEYVDMTFNLKGYVKKTSPVKSGTIDAKPTDGSENENQVPEEATLASTVDTAKPAAIEASAEKSGKAEEPATEQTLPEDKEEKATSLLGIFLEGFAFGWIALFMPCIFPMIPLTVSFFTKQSKSKNEGIGKAVLYGLSIIGIYVILGLLFTIIFGASALNELATDPIFNIFFFALFVIFALSFFGAFEITLPSSWVNKADEASNKGGLIGIFFMAFTLSLVSFSCTGPLIGTLLVDAGTKGEFLGPAAGMFGFSLALAIPFMAFAAFPGWLNSMPKSGGWLNNLKVTLGFLELAFAFKFLSTADMVLQAHYLEREMFFAIWVGIDFLIVLYLLGVFITPNDSKVERIGVTRLTFAILFTVLGFYLLPGIWGAPVKLVSGFPPPEHYAESKGGAYANHGGGNSGAAEDLEVQFGDHCPFDLNCFNDFEAGMAYAKKVGKPVMIDFTGWGCVNCRKMEENVWSDPRVLERLRKNVVLISLYVDERTMLPEAEQYTSKDTGRKIKNVGNMWSEFQEVNFGAVAQPYYVFLGHDNLKPLHESAAYDPDIDKFINWLDRGVQAFEAQKK